MQIMISFFAFVQLYALILRRDR